MANHSKRATGGRLLLVRDAIGRSANDWFSRHWTLDYVHCVQQQQHQPPLFAASSALATRVQCTSLTAAKLVHCEPHKTPLEPVPCETVLKPPIRDSLVPRGFPIKREIYGRNRPLHSFSFLIKTNAKNRRSSN